mmetsp:Transcript_115828/g.328257  ORF Transcript_115828/g.328257 Transcript_115828/m.328257 type:complete len:260 (+) Transcript_115828:220-999(+)
MKGNAGAVPAGSPSLGGVAVLLGEQVELVDALHKEDIAGTLVHEHVLAPGAVAGALRPEAVGALLLAGVVHLHGLAGEDLERPVEPELAVVQVHPVRLLVERPDDPPQAIREENGVRVGLHSPVAEPEPSFALHLVPHRHEDLRVQGRLELPPVGALKVALDDRGNDPGGDLDGLAAVDPVLLAPEDAHLPRVLHGEQALLVAPRNHQREAVQRPPRVLHMCRRDCAFRARVCRRGCSFRVCVCGRGCSGGQCGAATDG